jgi:hypothetical protein
MNAARSSREGPQNHASGDSTAIAVMTATRTAMARSGDAPNMTPARLREPKINQPRHRGRSLQSLAVQIGRGYPAACLNLAAAASGVTSRWGEPSISNPTMNFRMVAERSSGG